MTAQKKFKRDAFEAIHQVSTGFQKANAINKKSLDEYDSLMHS